MFWIKIKFWMFQQNWLYQHCEVLQPLLWFSHRLVGQRRSGIQPVSSKELKGSEEAVRVTCIWTGLFYESRQSTHFTFWSQCLPTQTKLSRAQLGISPQDPVSKALLDQELNEHQLSPKLQVWSRRRGCLLLKPADTLRDPACSMLAGHIVLDSSHRYV